MQQRRSTALFALAVGLLVLGFTSQAAAQVEPGRWVVHQTGHSNLHSILEFTESGAVQRQFGPSGLGPEVALTLVEVVEDPESGVRHVILSYEVVEERLHIRFSDAPPAIVFRLSDEYQWLAWPVAPIPESLHGRWHGEVTLDIGVGSVTANYPDGLEVTGEAYAVLTGDERVGLVADLEGVAPQLFWLLPTADGLWLLEEGQAEGFFLERAATP